MSQEIRRRLAAREGIAAVTESDVPELLRIRRFSEGLERGSDQLRVIRLGRFSDGAELQPADVESNRTIGTFSRGQERLPDDAAGKSRVGSYGHGYVASSQPTVRTASLTRCATPHPLP
jgi:hypothetical protein